VFLLHGLSVGRTILISDNFILKKIKFVEKLGEMLKVWLARNHLGLSQGHPHLQYSLAPCRIATRQGKDTPIG